MIQSGKFDSSNMNIKKISTFTPLLTKVLARVKLVNPLPKIHTFIKILILTTKIR